jgi:hypothetical protein
MFYYYRDFHNNSCTEHRCLGETLNVLNPSIMYEGCNQGNTLEKKKAASRLNGLKGEQHKPQSE